MLARGGIHPRGVVLDSEFFELPLRFDPELLASEMSLLTEGAGWEGADASNVKQGVVSTHFRLSHTGSKKLNGPFHDVDERLQRAPYTRKVLGSLGSVIGNTAYMRLPPNASVRAASPARDSLRQCRTGSPGRRGSRSCH